MRTIIVFALLVGAAVAARKNPTRIVGGSPASVEQYPYMANMMFFWVWWWQQLCGGSVLTERIILSAAHCYDGDWPSDWNVRLGSSLASSGGTYNDVEALILHEQYNSNTMENDIALVRLKRNAVFSNVVQAARIPSPTYVVPDGAPVTALGWGSIIFAGQSVEQLQHVEIYVANHQLCTDRYEYLKTILPNWRYSVTDNMICAGYFDIGGKDSCQGDSGGPVAHNGDVIVGVVSWAYGCGVPGYPGVNVRVSKYTDWILANSN